MRCRNSSPGASQPHRPSVHPSIHSWIHLFPQSLLHSLSAFSLALTLLHARLGIISLVLGFCILGSNDQVASDRIHSLHAIDPLLLGWAPFASSTIPSASRPTHSQGGGGFSCHRGLGSSHTAFTLLLFCFVLPDLSFAFFLHDSPSFRLCTHGTGHLILRRATVCSVGFLVAEYMNSLPPPWLSTALSIPVSLAWSVTSIPPRSVHVS
ncbi:uncharacterized protein BJ171DRAFT_137091 [Polychytrium aggregatum]|uniref:uncharacterized protein n=1 Tax=Polychytrium aggregatum TaxID=110093 RepID=UPI0022FF0CF6|nr:uncharacterized protein BJ171DRAFT_137091 [Polychytrium aggregatum]KAI9203588.1 hypothetical protein BJ171DRAFT_137091 [Polychytrium aggregatum]